MNTKQKQKYKRITERDRCEFKALVVQTLGPKAYAEEKYLRLQPLELQLLVECAWLVQPETTSTAYQRMGISNEDGGSLLSRLQSMHQLAWCSHGLEFPAGARELLKPMRQRTVADPAVIEWTAADRAFLTACGVALDDSEYQRWTANLDRGLDWLGMSHD